MPLWKSDPRWEIDEGIDDPTRLFCLLRDLFPQATAFCAEGAWIAKPVVAVYEKHRIESNPAPRQILFPSPGRFACTPTPEFYEELVAAATGREPDDVLHHLFLFERESPLIEWHDAFANPMWLNGSLPEATIATLAGAFGVPYRR